MLAFAGMCVAALPWTPEIDMQPRLALIAIVLTVGLLIKMLRLEPDTSLDAENTEHDKLRIDAIRAQRELHASPREEMEMLDA